MPEFECLYFFTSSDRVIIEIKRTDLPVGVPISDIYKWLVLSLDSEKIQELRFKSMSSSEREEKRIFDEGEFRFNTAEGYFNSVGTVMTFKRHDCNQASKDMIERIKKYL